jgi:hypothetical protein
MCDRCRVARQEAGAAQELQLVRAVFLAVYRWDLSLVGVLSLLWGGAEGGGGCSRVHARLAPPSTVCCG